MTRELPYLQRHQQHNFVTYICIENHTHPRSELRKARSSLTIDWQQIPILRLENGLLPHIRIRWGWRTIHFKANMEMPLESPLCPMIGSKMCQKRPGSDTGQDIPWIQRSHSAETADAVWKWYSSRDPVNSKEQPVNGWSGLCPQWLTNGPQCSNGSVVEGVD